MKPITIDDDLFPIVKESGTVAMSDWAELGGPKRTSKNQNRY